MLYGGVTYGGSGYGSSGGGAAPPALAYLLPPAIAVAVTLFVPSIDQAVSEVFQVPVISVAVSIYEPRMRGVLRPMDRDARAMHIRNLDSRIMRVGRH